MIKEDNKRITITLTKKHFEYLDMLKVLMKVKTYGCVIRKILDCEMTDVSEYFKDIFDNFGKM